MTLRLCVGTLMDFHAQALSPAVVAPAAFTAWRERFGAVLATHALAMPPEPPNGSLGVTDDPGWGGYGSLVLWAAYVEQPQLARPVLEPEEWHKDRALAASLAPTFVTRFPTLMRGVELWLPGEFSDIFDVPGPADDELAVGSLGALENELAALNAATWRAAEHEALAWREQVDAGAERVDDLARRGFAIFVGLARHAHANHLSLWLAY